MSTRRSISGDITRPVRGPMSRRGTLPVPAGLPRRHPVLPPNPAAPAELAEAALPASPQSPVKPQPKLKPGRSHQLWELAQYPLIAGLALVASINATAGQIFIAAYAIFVIIIRRRASALSFGLALLILISVPVFGLLGLPGISENAAIYVYELLVVGTIQAILELKQSV